MHLDVLCLTYPSSLCVTLIKVIQKHSIQKVLILQTMSPHCLVSFTLKLHLYSVASFL